jgi:hypothetical protein
MIRSPHTTPYIHCNSLTRADAMTDSPKTPPGSSLERLRAWLQSEITLRLPGWAVALGGAFVLLLLLVALD